MYIINVHSSMHVHVCVGAWPMVGMLGRLLGYYYCNNCDFV